MGSAQRSAPDGSIGLPGFWYAACASSRLRKRPRAARVLDRDLVLFRDDRGRARALLDRCVHRGVRLSRGDCVAGGIACRYHGWRYDGDGRCVEIPSLKADQRIPARSEVPAFPCSEGDGYVWVYVGEGAPPAPPRIPEFARHRWLQGSAPMAFEWLKGLENNVDVCHAGFAHPWTHPQWFVRRLSGLRSQRLETRLTPTGLNVFGPATDDAAEPIPKRPYFSLRFDLPDRVTVCIGRALIVIYHFVPTGASECRLEWLTKSVLPVGPKTWWRPREPLIPRQDRRLLESAQPWYDREGDAFERSVEGDAPTLLLRRIVELAAAGLWDEKRASLPQRRVFEARF